MMTLVHLKLNLVVYLSHMKFHFQQKISSIYDGLLQLKMSFSDNLVGNIALARKLLPTAINGFLQSVIRFWDDALCFSDELQPSQIIICCMLAKLSSMVASSMATTSRSNQNHLLTNTGASNHVKSGHWCIRSYYQY